MSKGFRTEEDFLGKVQVPSDAYYGIFAVRAEANFRISGARPSRNFIRMLALVKKSCAEANAKIGSLDSKIAGAIAGAAQEVADGKFDSQFMLDSFTAGAGTPFNMNMNEVISNRALELLGKKKGEYSFVHPNNHVNMSQSSNDAIPAAIRLTIYGESLNVLDTAEKLACEIDRKAKEFSGVAKAGRTHLMDAVPLTVGDELSAFSDGIRAACGGIRNSMDRLKELPIGGTALGSGINTDPEFRKIVVQRIIKNTGIEVREGRNLFCLISQAGDFLAYSSAIRELAVSVHKLSCDLKLLSSGPNTAIGEYLLPEVEPGSSIMPGKVNPSVPECAEMVANRVISNDNAVLLACMGGQLQLNVQTPLILQSLTMSNSLLTNAMAMLRIHCVSGLKMDNGKIGRNLDSTLISLTALAPYFGYGKVSELVKQAAKSGKSIRETVLSEGILSAEEYDLLMSVGRLTRPSRRLRIEKKK